MNSTPTDILTEREPSPTFEVKGLSKLFVVPKGADLPDSFGIKKMEGDLVTILYNLRQTEGIVGAYAALSPDELALLVEQRQILRSPELVMILELGVDYPPSLLLYSEFMDTVSVNDLERFLTEQGIIEQRETASQAESFLGVKDVKASKNEENFTDI